MPLLLILMHDNSSTGFLESSSEDPDSSKDGLAAFSIQASDLYKLHNSSKHPFDGRCKAEWRIGHVHFFFVPNRLSAWPENLFTIQE